MFWGNSSVKGKILKNVLREMFELKGKTLKKIKKIKYSKYIQAYPSDSDLAF